MNNELILIIIRNSMIEDKYKVLQQTIECPLNSDSENHAFLLVNSRSGDRVGADLIKTHMKQIKIGAQPQYTMFFSIYDLYSQKERDQSFVDASDKIRCGKNVYIVICGGDGTIQWVIQQALNSKIDLQKIVFGVLPIGTGNDFAKSVGWGNFKFSVTQQSFQQLAMEISKSKVDNYDIWECSVQCFDSGSIVQIKNGIDTQRQGKSLKKNFTNYFGLGTDAQICYIAQKFKAKTAFLKKIAYGFAGFLSFWMFCGGVARKIKQTIQIGSSLEQQMGQLEMTESDIATSKDNSKKIKIGSFDGCLTFLNSTSSMDLSGVWETPYTTGNERDIDFQKQCVNDGLIELVSYRNEISLCLQRLLHMAKKVGQGRGPFYINFKQPKEGVIHSTYIHINGQPYKVKNIKSIRVGRSSEFPMGKIKVLYRQI